MVERRRPLAVCILLVALAAGCEEDSRVVRMAEEGAARQASQNQEMARVNREVAESHRRLATSHEELVALQREIREDQRELGTALRRESVLAAAIATLGSLLVAALPLALCWYLLSGIHRDDGAAAMGELLVEQLSEPQPLLAPPQWTARGLRRENVGGPPTPAGRNRHQGATTAGRSLAR